MRKYTWLIVILVTALVAVTFFAGCGSKKQSSVVTTSSHEGAKAPAAGAANTLGDLLKKSTGLSSYVMIMDMGTTKMRTAMKLEGGKPVAIKSDMGEQGWMLVRMDKKMQYMYNPATKSAMAIPISGSVQSAAQQDPMASLKALAGAKVASENVDGVNCLKVTSGQSTFWCEKEHGLPVQMEMSGKMMKFKYEQINSVPDSEFELPAGVQIQQMPAPPKAP